MQNIALTTNMVISVQSLSNNFSIIYEQVYVESQSHSRTVSEIIITIDSN